jgi:AcrR family transcriptional regulator
LDRGTALTAAREAVIGPCAESPAGLFTKLNPGPGRPAAEVADHQRARIHRAMVEIVAENGYDAVTVRELAQLAQISTRTFYQRYAGKEECFLQTHDLIVRRMLRRLASSQTGVHDWRTRMRLAFHAFVHELAGDPQAARLLLIEAYAAGPAALEQAQRVNRTLLGSSVGKILADTPDGITVPPLVVEGIAAGVASVARSRLLTGQLKELNDLSDQLLDWALSYCSEDAAKLATIDRNSTPRRLEARLRPVPSSNAEREEDRGGAPTGDLALLLSAATKLVASDGHDSLTVRGILATAGVSRRSFYTHFKCAEDCLAAALELQIDETLARAKRSRTLGFAWAGGIYQAIDTLCAEIGSSPVLAEICSRWAVRAGARGVQCHECLTLAIARLLADGAPAANSADQLTTEASAGAVVGALQQQKAPTSGECQAPYPAGTLTYLSLAPLIGADQAIKAIRGEQATAMRG